MDEFPAEGEDCSTNMGYDGDSPPEITYEPNQSAIVSIQENFPPSNDKDVLYDGIVEYLKKRTYPAFIKLTTDKVAARKEFREKCSLFRLNEAGQLLQGRPRGVHRHVLRRGELSRVFEFVHDALGHCCADVCAKVVSPTLWSEEDIELVAYEVVKQCGCRQLCGAWRSACNRETARFIHLKFDRTRYGGFTISLLSTSDNVDFSRFQGTVSEKLIQKREKEKKSTTATIVDGRHRIDRALELDDVLEKLHVAFVHCSVPNLQNLFKMRFYCPGYTQAAYEVYSRCWFCKLDGRRRRRFIIRSYDYDVEVLGDINTASRQFLIRARSVSLEEAEQFMTSVLELDENTITLNDAINMANAAEKNSTWKKRKLAMMFDTELKRRKHDETVRGVPAPTHLPADSVVMQRRKYKAKYRKSGETVTMMPKLIPPSEISLGPSGPNECSDTDDVTNVHSQRVECLSPPSVQQTCGESSLVQSEEADSIFTVPPLDEEQLHSFFQNTFSICFGQLSQMQPREWNSLYPCTDSVEDAGMWGEQTSNSTQTSIPDLVEFCEGQPAEDEQNALFESMAAIEPNESDYLEFPVDCDANLQLPMDCNANLQLPVDGNANLQFQKNCNANLQFQKNCNANLQFPKNYNANLQLLMKSNANLQLPMDCNANLQLQKNCNANLQLPKNCNANLQLPKNCNANLQFQKNCNANVQLSMDRNANLQLPKNFNANLQFPVNCNANIYNTPENYYRTSVDSAAVVDPVDDLDSLSLSSLTDLFERDAEPLDIFNSNEFIDPF